MTSWSLYSLVYYHPPVNRWPSLPIKSSYKCRPHSIVQWCIWIIHMIIHVTGHKHNLLMTLIKWGGGGGTGEYSSLHFPFWSADSISYRITQMHIKFGTTYILVQDVLPHKYLVFNLHAQVTPMHMYKNFIQRNSATSNQTIATHCQMFSWWNVTYDK